MTLAKIKKFKDALINIFDHKNKLIYIVESNNWSIKWDGRQITANLNKDNSIKGRTSLSVFGLKNKIIHFGSINAFLSVKNYDKLIKHNRIILTWFHLSPGDERIKKSPQLNDLVDLVHTSCLETKEGLIKNGFAEEKIVVIPLGVDLTVFSQKPGEKNNFKKMIGLPENKIIIGSFQKDGNGWGEGLEPKMIKGPDIFCDVVEKLATKYPIHVLLTGPARGYVKKRLAKAGIGYTHKNLKNYYDIADYYKCLDLYIISSRVEGGPKALLESWAIGVPVVSTRMGMPADIICDSENGLLAEVEDVNGLVAAAEKILADKNLKEKIVAKALEEVKNYSWDILVQRYYDEIYKKL